MKTLPYKLNVPAMQLRLQRLPDYRAKISALMHLTTLKRHGALPVSDLMQILKAVPVPAVEYSWHACTIADEDELFVLSDLLRLSEKCGTLAITRQLANNVNYQLNKIYRKP